MKMKNYTVNVPIKLTSQEIADIVTTAFEGGSNYWIVTVDVCRHYASGWHCERNLVRAKIKAGIELHEGPMYSLWKFWENDSNGYMIDFDEDEDIVLTAEKVVKGLQAMAQTWAFVPAIERLLVSGQYDADDADLALQFALFGEVVYG